MLSADVIEGLTELDWRIQLGLVLPAQLSETRTPAVEGCRPPRDPGAAWLFCASAQTTARLGEVAGLDRRRLGPGQDKCPSPVPQPVTHSLLLSFLVFKF